MRVGVNTLFLIPGEVGGSETVTRNLVSALRTVAPELELLLFTNKENDATFTDYSRVCLNVFARNRASRVIAEQTSLVRQASRARVDVLLSLGYTAPLYTPFPQAVMIYDAQFVAHPEDFPMFSRMVQRVIIPYAARRANVVLTGSHFAKQEIVQRLGVPEKSVEVVPFGISPVFSPAEKDQESGAPYLLCVCNAYPHKNLARFVRVFQSLSREIPHQLIIVGKSGAGEPPPIPRVERRQQVTLSELVNLYRGCELFVLPSLYEGFGFPVLEAMACGARVVAARSGSLPEVAGDAATYFDPTDEHDMANAIRTALEESSDTRTRYRTKGFQQAASYTWEATAARVTEILKGIVALE
ncbi:MAG TPA: glycosyltransferase family 1 protein [Candidatus Hydrogenedentes bacterium]|nr:glycosyltransferase family 1 protein [Candidatus Hydrogenedentota bacterium]HOL76817.1 glycosyltransferase family 1 protein [Candidatus Hydrogenedentota bacterium]HPO86241.1 glycosyltransferase family 1 protein [Candidatus Hydrogenedentota bacterium]